ncbi:general transcription factor II-I repeat domain-containing protein 2 [Trichonephila clavipes]|uniref:General transcription factor II-I repeat domain-containing protein 2 n=1 Tax=Trichonephila clavipes TaxID=2585209 RepID=A0A8X6RMP8_TRICX|nr:general transcription factor II-I repeat domain-containing protein 2 [Trichonephila clavipes]
MFAPQWLAPHRVTDCNEGHGARRLAASRIVVLGSKLELKTHRPRVRYLDHRPTMVTYRSSDWPKEESGFRLPLPNEKTSPVDETAENLRDQHYSTISTCQAYLIAIDESTDIRNIAQLAISICGCDVNLKINEELLEVIPMHNALELIFFMYLWNL